MYFGSTHTVYTACHLNNARVIVSKGVAVGAHSACWLTRRGFGSSSMHIVRALGTHVSPAAEFERLLRSCAGCISIRARAGASDAFLPPQHLCAPYFIFMN